MASFDDSTIYENLSHRDVTTDARMIWGEFLRFVRRDESRRNLGAVPEAEIAEDLLCPDQVPSHYMELFASFLAAFFTNSALRNGLSVVTGKAIQYKGPSWLFVDGDETLTIQLNRENMPDSSIPSFRDGNLMILHELAHALYHWDDAIRPLAVKVGPAYCPPSDQRQEMQAWWWCTTFFSLWAGAIANARTGELDVTLTKLSGRN